MILGKPNRDCCDAVAGNTRAGKLLHQIVFWLNSPKAPVFNGHRWVAFTREQWTGKTNLTINQIRRELMVLTRAEVIVREQHKFFDKVPNFIRLSAKGMEALCAAQVAQNCATQGAQNCATLISKPKELNLKNKQKIASASGVALLGESEDSEKASPEKQEKQTNVIPFPVDQGGSPVATVAEIKLAIEAKIAVDATKPLKVYHPDSITPLKTIWQGATGEYPTGQVCGMLKDLIKKVDPVPAPELLKYAVAHWGDIVYEAEASYSAFKCPDKPKLSWLLTHAHVAVACKERHDKKTAQSIASLAKPNSMAAKKAAHLAMLGVKVVS